MLWRSTKSNMAMPNFRLSIVKTMGNRNWSNDYLLNISGFVEGSDVANALVTFERNLYLDLVTIAYYRLSTMQVGDRTFRHVNIGLPGLNIHGGADYLPLFNCVRVDLSTADHDPARKYFRIPIIEGNQANGQLTGAYRTFLQGKVDQFLVNSVALDNIVTSKGYVVTGASVHGLVQERQLNRRRRKKAAMPQ